MKQADSNPPRRVRIRYLHSVAFSGLWIVLCFSHLIIRQLHAEVITDGTVGVAQNLGGPEFVIPQSLGSTRGANLFHSFRSFNIGNTESATFTGSNTLQNVISRVTGGQSSSINGLLRSQIGQAAFYFINPAGVVFGNNAVIDVPGDFHVSTADQLRFSDGVAFNALQSEGSSLSMATPAEFGFLSDQSAAIRVVQSSLNFATGSTTSLSAGQLVIDSGVLINEGGEIRMTSVGVGNAAVPIGGDLLDNAAGSLEITNSQVESSGNGAGRIMINGGDAVISGSGLFANNTGVNAPDADNGLSLSVESLQLNNSQLASVATNTGNTGIIDVVVKGSFDVLAGGLIATNTLGPGDAGTVNIRAGSLTVDSQSSGSLTGIFSNAEPNSTGNAGNVSVSATSTLNVLNGGLVKSESFGAGGAGTVMVRGEKLSIDGQSSDALTGIVSIVNPDSLGNAGGVDIVVSDDLAILNGGNISSITAASGEAGAVNVEANNLTIDGQSSDSLTGIFTSSVLDATGNAGNIRVSAIDTLNILGRGRISSSTSGDANAGNVSVSATGTLNIFNEGNITSTTSGAGNAGNIDVSAKEALNILNEGSIRSNTSASGDAGQIDVRIGMLTIDGQSIPLATGIFTNAFVDSSGNAGNIEVSATETIDILNGGTINVSTLGSGNAGNAIVSAAKSLNLLNGAQIAGNTSDSGNGGAITVLAKNITINSQSGGFRTGIFSETNPDSLGNAARVGVSVTDDLNILNGGLISSGTFASGNAGSVTLQAKNLTIDGQNSESLTGVFSDGEINSTGNVGNIGISVTDNLNIVNSGAISSSIFGSGDGGAVSIQANNITIDGGQSGAFVTGIFGRSSTDIIGNVGSIEVSALESTSILNGGLISSDAFASREAGSISLSTAGTLNIFDGGLISSNAFASGAAGTVDVQAGILNIGNPSDASQTGISSDALPLSTGNAGNVGVSVAETAGIVDGGVISSSTFASGNGGAVFLQAKNLTIDGQTSNSLTGVFSNASPATGSFGDGGSIDISITDLLAIRNGGAISSNTFTDGNAGNINLNAGQVVVAGNPNRDLFSSIATIALDDSLGQAGNITLNTGSLLLSEFGLISIGTSPNVAPETLASIQPTTINITADEITLRNTVISTESFGNVPAGSIRIIAADRLFLDPSAITTAANNANGGNITLSGKTARLDDSQITTSVTGQGDGGNITLDFKHLILDTGFIRANTAGAGAKGGEINVNVDALIASGNNLLTGGNTPQTFQIGSGRNVIQAAAPDGISGFIEIASPELNISGDLVAIDAGLKAVEAIVHDPCTRPGAQQSTLITGRRGGIRESPQDAQSVPLDRNRLNRVLSDPGNSGAGIVPHQPNEPVNGGVNPSLMVLSSAQRDCEGR